MLRVMSMLIETVKQALKEKAPQLHEQLRASGQLGRFAEDRASEISSAVVQMTQEQRLKGKWDNLGPMECAAKMKAAAALNRETAIAEALEFPPDQTSSQSQDGTTG